MWGHVAAWLHFTPQTWMSASLLSFVVAALATLVLGAGRLSGRHSDTTHPGTRMARPRT